MSKQRAKASLVGMAMFLITSTIAAQVTEEWVARYDGPARDWDVARAMAIDDAGNVYVTGESGGSVTESDYATVKYSSNGEELWVSRYEYDGSAGAYNEARAIAVDDAGNVYVTGVSAFSETHKDYATVKYNSEGAEQWVTRYESGSAFAIAIDDAGNVYVTGESEGDYATVKYSTSGVERWVARYESGSARAIAVDDAGNVYVTGESEGDYATVKYNSSGVEQWVARYDGSGDYYDNDEANAIAIDDAGNVYVTGESDGSDTVLDYATVKYNSSGVEQWVARYDGGGWNEGEAIAVDDSGNVYATGSSEWDYATIKYDTTGIEQWVARYDGPGSGRDGAYAIAMDDAGSVYVTGYSEGSGTSADYATVKYSQGPGVTEASPLVSGHRLEVAQLTPQPVITYTLPADTRVSLKVYDVTGKLVRTLVSGSQGAGTHTACWDARNDSNQWVSTGLYFVSLETADFRATGKLVLVR